MSEWNPCLTKIETIEKLPNSDFLSITEVEGQPVIFKTETYQVGDLAVYLPLDSILPFNPEHPIVKDSGLKPGHCIEARRMRGVYSNGMLVPAKVCFTEEELKNIPIGTHIAERLGITKWEDNGDQLDRLSTKGNNHPYPSFIPKYTDIEGLPKWKNVLEPGEEVVISLKIHGSSASFSYHKDKFYVCSRNFVKDELIVDGLERNIWWELAKRIDLENKLKNLNSILGHDNTVIYGEVYGSQIQGGWSYDTTTNTKLRIFDTYNIENKKYNDFNETYRITEILQLEMVPILYVGPWNMEECDKLRNGPDPLNKNHIREGYVVKPTKEQWHPRLGRKILKRVSEEYKLKLKRK